MERPALDTLISTEEIAARIEELAQEILDIYGDEPVLCIGVLKGSFIFLADLVRAYQGDARCDFLGVSSYRGTKSTGVVRLTHDLRSDVAGQHCLIVEDIVDTGLTLSYLVRMLAVRKPKSLRVCTLLDKPSRRKVPVQVDLVGFTIPDAFVIGYGLDLDEQFRGLPQVGVLRVD